MTNNFRLPGGQNASFPQQPCLTADQQNFCAGQVPLVKMQKALGASPPPSTLSPGCPRRLLLAAPGRPGRRDPKLQVALKSKMRARIQFSGYAMCLLMVLRKPAVLCVGSLSTGFCRGEGRECHDHILSAGTADQLQGLTLKRIL